MSLLAKIATQKAQGISIDDIAQNLSLSLEKINLIERIGTAQARVAYHKSNSLGGVAYRLGVSRQDAQTIDEVYKISSSKPPEKTLPLFDIAAHQGKPTQLADIPTQTSTSQNHATTMPAQKTTRESQDTFDRTFFPKKENSAEKKESSYGKVTATLEPYAAQMFLNVVDAQQLLDSHSLYAPLHVVREALTKLSGGLTHGERVREWAKTYASQQYSLVEISRLLGDQHIFATKKLLTSLDIHVCDGFELIDYRQTLLQAQFLPEREREEIELICRGASYKDIAAHQSCTQTRAGQRISELGLREVWQCAHYLKRAKKNPIIILSI